MSNSAQEMQQNLELLKSRISKAVNVSAAFNNCFFHSYALHLIINQQQFPADLFDIHPNDDELIRRLKQAVTKFDDLDNLFTSYSQLKKLPGKSNFLVEKTLILGLLLRSWFGKELAKDDVKVNYFESSDARVTFLFVVGQAASVIDDLAAVIPNPTAQQIKEALDPVLSENPIYLSNQAFFLGNIEGIGPLSFLYDEQGKQKLSDYWMTTGHENYCKLLLIFFKELSMHFFLCC